jgi:hypothetical protein
MIKHQGVLGNLCETGWIYERDVDELFLKVLFSELLQTTNK